MTNPKKKTKQKKHVIQFVNNNKHIGLRLLMEEKCVGTLKLGKKSIKLVKSRKTAEEVYTGDEAHHLPHVYASEAPLVSTDLTKPCIYDSKTCECTYHSYRRKQEAILNSQKHGATGGNHRHGDLSIRNIDDFTASHVFAVETGASKDETSKIVSENGNIDNEFVMSVKNEVQIDDWKWKQKCYYCKVTAL
ncbi:hypothetical protein RFI_14167 [Reticulomyxa filosa]|uniref:Uncharacterized protein n=1 Tax=Reticulomyxa filosa TaxID=46433 RepID=X6NAT2_RETFI|nr:hypothetical protein RFI_14167 [Reticulomyxa filosa]|eukprot:ETO23018.1 hypothetical protein RFI_14167 [Reticulomyxa filosa]